MFLLLPLFRRPPPLLLVAYGCKSNENGLLSIRNLEKKPVQIFEW